MGFCSSFFMPLSNCTAVHYTMVSAENGRSKVPEVFFALSPEW